MAIGDWVKIGKSDGDWLQWDVLVLDIEEGFDKLYTEKTGRTMGVGAPLTLDPLGTFHSHTVTFARKRGSEGAFDQLYNYLSIPRYEGIDVSIVHGQTTLTYKAYTSTGKRKVKRIDEKHNVVYWDALQVKFIPTTAQTIPGDNGQVT